MKRLVLVIPLLLLLFHTFFRPWTYDEGVYLLVSKLIHTQGLLPYQDVAYRQMPLYPYLMSCWQMLFGERLEICRLFSYLALLPIVYVLLRQKYGLFLSGIFLSHPFVWDYFILTKPYALTASLAIVGLSLNATLPFASGFLMGTGAMVRFVVAPLLIAGWKKQVLKGFGLGILPAIFCAIAFYDTFWFLVFKTHSLKNKGTNLFPVVQQCAAIFSQPINLLLLFLFVWAAVVSWKQRKNIFVLSSFLVIVPTLLLRPFYDEYVGFALPFGLLAIGQGSTRKVVPILLGVTWILGLYSNVAHIKNDIALWRGVSKPANSIAAVHEVSRALTQMSLPEDEILSFWPGYAYQSNRNVPRGLEDGLTVKELAGKLSVEESKRFHIATPEDVIHSIQKGRVRWVVIDDLSNAPGLENWVAKRYSLTRNINGTHLYEVKRK